MNVIRIILALGLSFLVSQRARAEDDSPDELIRRVAELSQQGKYKEAIPLTEHLVTLMKQARGDEDAETASIDFLSFLYQRTGEYAKAEPRNQEALQICQKVLGPEHSITADSLDNLALLEFDRDRIDKAKASART